ncbi:calcium-binding protein [Segnochrobactraceae bacterium EtOH-i3]
MASYTITADRGSLQTAQNDTVFLKAGVLISGGIDMRGNGPGAGGLSGSQSLFLYGSVYGSVNDYWTDTSGGNYIQVGAHGSISATGWGTIQLGGGGNTILNAGEITSSIYGNAIYIWASSGGFQDQATTLVNTGLIAGGNRGSASDLITITGAQSVRITNSGEMIAGTNASAISASGVDDSRLVNTGTIVGDVELYGGAFVVDTRFGKIFGTVTTGVGNDFVRASAGDDSISGGGGNDTLVGFDGDDSLDGGAGTDVMSGGAGDDTFWVDSIGDVVRERSGEGNDLVISTISYTLNGNVEDLQLLSGGFVGTGNTLGNMITGNEDTNRLSGNAGNDSLIGGLGNDTLDGGTGADRMDGGAGNDFYLVENVGDQIVELIGEGTDTVQSTVSLTLAANVEKLTLTGSAALSGTGNVLANTITGNSRANTLSGGAGSDSLSGGAGNDSLNGGSGADVLTGGTGADRFIYTAVSDSLVSTAGRDRITDFDRTAGDRIDLRSIDANSLASGDQAFQDAIVTSFTGVAGQLRFFTSGGSTVVQGDVNGDKVADFAIQFDGTRTFTGGEFLL